MSPLRRSILMEKRFATFSMTSMACTCSAETLGIFLCRGRRGVPSSGAFTSWQMGLPFEKNKMGSSSRVGVESLLQSVSPSSRETQTLFTNFCFSSNGQLGAAAVSNTAGSDSNSSLYTVQKLETYCSPPVSTPPSSRT